MDPHFEGVYVEFLRIEKYIHLFFLSVFEIFAKINYFKKPKIRFFMLERQSKFCCNGEGKATKKAIYRIEKYIKKKWIFFYIYIFFLRILSTKVENLRRRMHRIVRAM